MEIKLNPEQVDNYVRDCIMKSAIGDAIEKALNKNINEILTAYNSPIKTVIVEEIKIMVRTLIEKPDTRAIILAAIAKRLTDETIGKLIEYSVNRLEKDIQDARDRGDW